MNRSKHFELNVRRALQLRVNFCHSLFIIILFLSLPSWAQKKQLVQVKAFDQQLIPYKNVEVSINNKEYFSMGNKGVAFVELLETDLPIKSIRIKDEKLETASWNYGKGIIEIIIRTRSYQMVQVVVRDENNVRLPNLTVTFKGRKVTTAQTDKDGKLDVPTALDEKISAPGQFSIPEFNVVDVQMAEGQTVLIVSPIKVAAAPIPLVEEPVTKKTYFKDFDLSKLDSIQSLTAFYAIFRSIPIKDMSEQTKMKLDAKFNQLVAQLQDSVLSKNSGFIGKISDSSFVNDDVKNLLAQATQESITLEAQRSDFENKIKIIEDKLASGISTMDDSTRSKLLSDLTRLEMILGQNEKMFYKNQNDYRSIIDGLKEKYLDISELENKLSLSEAQRLEDQRQFRQKLLITSSILFVFAILILLLIYFGDKLKKQKKELVRVNEEINRINENLEDLVAERTKLLEDANKELDTFLYRASHDLRSPVCSIIGLCNIALMSDGESKDLVQKVVMTTGIMDKLLKKLSIISEINQPTNFSSITLVDLVEHVKQDFGNIIDSQNINFTINCPADLVIYSYPNLVETIIANLIENAFFYSVLKDPLNATVSLDVAINNNDVVISVRDNGIGVEEAISHKLFDMFFKGTEKSKGHGLGLYIVQRSAQALDGKVDVESEFGSYTKFTVEFPLKTIAFEAQQPKLELHNGFMN